MAEEVATFGIKTAREWNQAQEPTKMMITHEKKLQKRAPINNIDWNGAVTCKSDAAWNKQTKKAGLAWIITGTRNNIIEQKATIKEDVNSPLIAEALALRSAISTAVNLDLTKMRVFSDNQTLIRAINGDMQAKEIYGIVHDIHQITSAFIAISFSHLPREKNIDADRLAKRALGSVSFVSPMLD